MAVTRRAVIERIEVNMDGTVGVRFAKQLVEGDQVLHQEWHRATVEPTTDVDVHIGAIVAHLAEMGYGGLANCQRIKEHVALARRDAISVSSANGDGQVGRT